MRAVVDQDLCIGCGLCPELCPEVFEMGEDDKAHVKTDPVPPESEESCRQAADQCPQSAIRVE